MNTTELPTRRLDQLQVGDVLKGDWTVAKITPTSTYLGYLTVTKGNSEMRKKFAIETEFSVIKFAN